MTKLSPSLYFAFSLLLIFWGCQNQDNQERQQSNNKPKTRSEPAREFNTSDKSTETNDNVHIAFDRVTNSTPEQIWQSAQPVSPTTLVKNPYSFIGKLYKLTGSVYNVTEFPPITNLTGRWGEVLISVRNPNSPLGTTSVSFMYNGDIEEIKENTDITCAGYFIGTYESQNAGNQSKLSSLLATPSGPAIEL